MNPTRTRPDMDPRQRSMLWLLSLIWLAFVAYGSLVPLNYHPLSLETAGRAFLQILQTPGPIYSRVDIATNVLLTIPLGFLWLGTVWTHHGLAARLAISVLVWFCCLVISTSIEFSQMFFADRTPSAGDIAAQSAGALLGIILWWWRGTRLWNWLADWHQARGSKHQAERLLLIYLLVVFLYNLLPLDLTLNPVEIYHKWVQGRIILVPLGYYQTIDIQVIYDLATDILLWVPVSALWIISKRKDALRSWLSTLGAAATLEGMQILVFSRVSDVTDLITAAIGATLGVLLSRQWQKRSVSSSRSGSPRWLWGSALLLGWCVLLAAVFWYPYDFNMDRQFLRARISSLQQAPLGAYYQGTEFRAATEMLHKTLFFSPLGFILAAMMPPPTARIPRWFWNLVSASVLISCALLIELGQVPLPSKVLSTTDWALASLGGIAGYAGYLFVHSRLSSGLEKPAFSQTAAPDQAMPPQPRPSSGFRPRG